MGVSAGVVGEANTSKRSFDADDETGAAGVDMVGCAGLTGFGRMEAGAGVAELNWLKSAKPPDGLDKRNNLNYNKFSENTS